MAKIKSSVSMTGEFDPGEIRNCLIEQLDHKQLKQFIIDLDEAICDLNFSDTLCHHFAELKKRLDKERY